jgi:Short C-terminal domain
VGFFKDIKNARELAAEHGGMPSMKEGLRDARMVLDDRGEREILKKGTPARAVVKGILMQAPGERMAMQVPLEIHPEQGQPYVVNYIFPAPRMQTALSPGMEVPVKVSPEDPQRIAVQWDALKATVAAEGGAVAASIQGLNNATDGRYGQMLESSGVMMPGMPGYDPSQPMMFPEHAFDQAAAAAAPEDPQARLAKLDQLKQAGLIDEAEYQAKRKQIIDSI